MRTLRQRFLLATGLLLGLQVASTGLALGSWRQVVETARSERELAAWRAEVSALGAALREEYVHQAHTYVLGDASHLDHGRDSAGTSRALLDRVAQLPLHPAEREVVHALAVDHTLFQAWFSERVAPLARAGGLDRPTAAALHATTEAVAGRLTHHVDRLLRLLDADQAVVRRRAEIATTRAWWATAGLTLGALVLVGLIARALAAAVLAPVDAIRAAAAGVHTAPGDDELAEIARAFETVAGRLTAEEERRVRAERLAALGELSAAIAHELLNPLTVILGHVRMIGDPSLEPVRQEAEHARRVVQGLLGFARPGQEPPEALDLADLAREAVDRATPAAELRDVSLRLEARPTTRTAPPSAVRQILDNLLRNAIASSPTGAAITVVVDGDVEVRDRGPGIPAEIRSRLYEPFVTGRAEGTGLGLAVCQRIARALGGRIEHMDRDGGGTVARWIVGD